jgi:anti-sigma factor RsiW
MKEDCRKTQDWIDRYLDGLLSIRDRETFQNHLARCSNCREVLEQEKRVISLIRSLPVQALPPEVLARLEKKTFGNAGERVRIWIYDKLLVPRWPRWVLGLAAAASVLLILRLVTDTRHGAPAYSEMEARTARSQALLSLNTLSELLQKTEIRVVSDVLLKDVPGTVKQSLEKTLPFLKGE